MCFLNNIVPLIVCWMNTSLIYRIKMVSHSGTELTQFWTEFSQQTVSPHKSPKSRAAFPVKGASCSRVAKDWAWGTGEMVPVCRWPEGPVVWWQEAHWYVWCWESPSRNQLHTMLIGWHLWHHKVVFQTQLYTLLIGCHLWCHKAIFLPSQNSFSS